MLKPRLVGELGLRINSVDQAPGRRCLASQASYPEPISHTEHHPKRYTGVILFAICGANRMNSHLTAKLHVSSYFIAVNTA
jgi:hypothetical protein